MDQKQTPKKVMKTLLENHRFTIKEFPDDIGICNLAYARQYFYDLDMKHVSDE